MNLYNEWKERNIPKNKTFVPLISMLLYFKSFICHNNHVSKRQFYNFVQGMHLLKMAAITAVKSQL